MRYSVNISSCGASGCAAAVAPSFKRFGSWLGEHLIPQGAIVVGLAALPDVLEHIIMLPAALAVGMYCSQCAVSCHQDSLRVLFLLSEANGREVLKSTHLVGAASVGCPAPFLLQGIQWRQPTLC